MNYELEDRVERGSSVISVMFAIPEGRPWLTGSSRNDGRAYASQVAEEDASQVWGCDVTAEDLGLVELQEMPNRSRPLDTGSGEEAGQLETLAHESCTRTQLDVGEGPSGVRADGSPVRVRLRMELGCLATLGHTPVGEEDDGGR